MFTLLYTVQPWEQGIRVRLGKHTILQGPGIHFKLPFIDIIYIQNTRVRMMNTHNQTISTTDGKSLSLAGSVRYKIKDILLLHKTLHQAEETICQEIQSLVAQYVMTHCLEACSPVNIQGYVNTHINLLPYGIVDTEFFMTNCTYVKTFRIISDSIDTWSSTALNTQEPKSSSGSLLL